MYETLFAAVNTAVLPAWLLLLVAPGWRYTQRIAVKVIVAALSCVYVTLIVYSLVSGVGAEGVDFQTMEGVAAIFSHPLGIVAGWTHYLAFDLFVGAWIVRDARATGLPHLATVPAIILCFLAGPAGYLLYCLIRYLRARIVNTK